MNNFIGRIVKDLKRYWIAIIIFVIYNVVIRTVFHAFCPFWIIYGLPCPGCGITRAAIYLLSGQVVRAYNLNPAIFAWAPLIVYGFISRYILGKKIRYGNMLLIVVCVITLLMYGYRMVFIFPSNPPLTYNYHCIMKNIFPDYVKLLRIIFES